MLRSRATRRRMLDLEAEIIRLREENARMRVERRCGSTFTHVTDGDRELLDTLHRVDATHEVTDESWQVLAQALLLRESLLSVCGDLEAVLERVDKELASPVAIDLTETTGRDEAVA